MNNKAEQSPKKKEEGADPENANHFSPTQLTYTVFQF
jgi:hypothetical protein